MLATTGPVYTITVPSGDQAGLKAGPVIKRTGAQPSRGLLKSPGPVASLPPVTIHLSSADQPAAPRTSMASASGWGSPPSAETMCRRSFSWRLRTTVTRPPSCETAGGAINGPSAPFQLSSAWTRTPIRSTRASTWRCSGVFPKTGSWGDPTRRQNGTFQ